MKSTGEVMGVGKTFGEAFYKAIIGSNERLPVYRPKAKPKLSLSQYVIVTKHKSPLSLASLLTLVLTLYQPLVRKKY